VREAIAIEERRRARELADSLATTLITHAPGSSPGENGAYWDQVAKRLAERVRPHMPPPLTKPMTEQECIAFRSEKVPVGKAFYGMPVSLTDLDWLDWLVSQPRSDEFIAKAQRYLANPNVARELERVKKEKQAERNSKGRR
jgi:hypothetical protein